MMSKGFSASAYFLLYTKRTWAIWRNTQYLKAYRDACVLDHVANYVHQGHRNGGKNRNSFTEVFPDQLTQSLTCDCPDTAGNFLNDVEGDGKDK